jgi:hypothetical protein
MLMNRLEMVLYIISKMQGLISRDIFSCCIHNLILGFVQFFILRVFLSSFACFPRGSQGDMNQVGISLSLLHCTISIGCHG